MAVQDKDASLIIICVDFNLSLYDDILVLAKIHHKEKYENLFVFVLSNILSPPPTSHFASFSERMSENILQTIKIMGLTSYVKVMSQMERGKE